MRGPSLTMTDEHNSRRRPAYSGPDLGASVSSLFRNDESDANEGDERPHTPPPHSSAAHGSPALHGSSALHAPWDSASSPPRTPPNSPPPEINYDGTPTPPDTPPASPPPKANTTPSATPGRVMPKRTNTRAEPLPVEPLPVEPPKPEPAPERRRAREKRFDLLPPAAQLAPQEEAPEKPRDIDAKGATPENARWRMTPRMAAAAQKLGEAVSRRARRDPVQAARAGKQAGPSSAPAWPAAALFAQVPSTAAGPRWPASAPRVPIPPMVHAPAPLPLQAPISTTALAPAEAPTPTPSLAVTPELQTAPPPPPEAAAKTMAPGTTPECRAAHIAPPLSTAGVKRSTANVLLDEASSSKRRRIELDSPSPSHTDSNAGHLASTSSGATAPASSQISTATVTPEVTRDTENDSDVGPSASRAQKRTRRHRGRTATQPRDARGRFVSKRDPEAAGEQTSVWRKRWSSDMEIARASNQALCRTG